MSCRNTKAGKQQKMLKTEKEKKIAARQLKHVLLRQMETEQHEINQFFVIGVAVVFGCFHRRITSQHSSSSTHNLRSNIQTIINFTIELKDLIRVYFLCAKRWHNELLFMQWNSLLLIKSHQMNNGPLSQLCVCSKQMKLHLLSHCQLLLLWMRVFDSLSPRTENWNSLAGVEIIRRSFDFQRNVNKINNREFIDMAICGTEEKKQNKESKETNKTRNNCQLSHRMTDESPKNVRRDMCGSLMRAL